MHTVTFHNLGNADCVRINLSNGKKVLFDYANCRNPNDASDLKCDLPKELRDDLDGRDYFDVVAFTHLDKDHYAGSTEFFYFDHIAKHQDDVDGEPRIKMNTMWVPAAIITEALSREEGTVEAKAIQLEARERFKAGSGIRVFSRPERLKDWCDKNGVDLEKRKGIITDAGRSAPEFSLAKDDVDFFVHSPFAVRQDECTVEDRNSDALVMHATFTCGGEETRVFLGSDAGYEVLSDIVKVTEGKKRPERLNWDVFKLPHHCSYLTLSDEKGKDKTKPVPEVARLFEGYGQDRCIVVSTSDTIPEKGDARDKQEGANPPHRQAAAYFEEDVVAPKDGEFIVTMEHPSKSKPTPLVINIDDCKAHKQVRAVVTSGAAAATFTAPRAGWAHG